MKACNANFLQNEQWAQVLVVEKKNDQWAKQSKAWKKEIIDRKLNNQTKKKRAEFETCWKSLEMIVNRLLFNTYASQIQMILDLRI